ncbi:MAG TPA: GDSL-type esterase/lipase family protein [Solimonas sp.]|nr:GDSL-type esterase/lipase family protein [Solimonas sp.]
MKRLLALLLAATAIAGCPDPATPTGRAENVRIVSADHPDLRYEGHWHRGAVATTNNSGSRLRFNFQGSRLVALFDVAGIRYPPQIYVSIDQGESVKYIVDREHIDLADGLQPGVHEVLLVVKDVDEAGNRWEPPFESALQLRGFELDAASRLLAPPPASRLRMEFYGDSITQGVLARCNVSSAECSDGATTYAYLTARTFAAESNQVGFGAQGITKGGDGRVPKAAETFGLNFQGSPSDPGFVPEIVVVNQGTNDWPAPAAEFRQGYKAYIEQIRAAYPDAWIFAMGLLGIEGLPFPKSTYIEQIIAEIGDPRIVHVDTRGWLGPGDFDGFTHIHPTVEGHRKVAARLVPLIAAATGIAATEGQDPKLASQKKVD